MAEKTKPTPGGAAGQAPGPGRVEQQTPQGAQDTGFRGSPSQESQQTRESGALQQRGQAGLTRYGRNPFAMMQQLSNEMDRLFDSFFSGAPSRRFAQDQRAPTLWSPEVEMSEEGSRLRVCVDLPGMSKDDVKLDIQQGTLVIQGERREERSEGGAQQGFRRSERRFGSFYRAIPLPDDVKEDQAEARMNNGVLEITFPLEERKQPRRLEIK